MAGKSFHNDVFDAALAVIAAGDEGFICSAEPTTYAEASSTYKLADYVPSFTGPADGDVSGRKITLDAETGITVDSSGTASHIAICANGTSKLLYVTTITTPQALVAGNTADLAAADIEITDPA